MVRSAAQEAPVRALVFSSLLMAACAGQVPSTDSTAQADTGALPVLQFNADWTLSQSAPLIAGQKAIIRYDAARLPRCRAKYHGLDAWNIQASWAADGGFAQHDATMQWQSGAFVPVDITFSVPYGHDLAVWFLNSDEYGCTDWDSDYGRNFHFAIQATTPVIHFRRDWTVSVDGALQAGAPFAVDYEIERLPYCRQDYNGYQTWDVTAHARFDGGATIDAPVTTSITDYERVQAPATFDAPAGAHTVELWFDNADRTGCHTWDSDYGQNFRFELR
jgi:hypothetical protein